MKSSPKRLRLVGLARVFLYALAASAVLVALASRRVYAGFEENALQAGRDLEGLNDLLGSSNTVFINGAAINVSTAVVDASPHDVLDRFEGVCREHPEVFVRALLDIPSTLLGKAKVASPPFWRLGVVRKEDHGDGALACFTDDRPGSIAELKARLRAFAASSDLAAFGHLRYVYVRGDGKRTHVRTVWADGPMNLKRMFPAAGDAEGVDSAVAPRPRGARRIFSATTEEVPFSIHVYDSPDPPDTARQSFDDAMRARGWQVAPSPKGTAVAYVKSGATVILTVTRKDAGATGSLVTLTDMGAHDTPAQADVTVLR
jgi:hypothetical protein